MFIGKLACGLWLLKLPKISSWMVKSWPSWATTLCCRVEKDEARMQSIGRRSKQFQHQSASGVELTLSTISKGNTSNMAARSPKRSNQGRKIQNVALISGPTSVQVLQRRCSSIRKPVSIYPSLILGSAMTARGEIGFLVSSLAQGNDIFFPSTQTHESKGTDDPLIFLIVTWAILLCTITGPMLVGMLVKRVRKLEETAATDQQTNPKDVLGGWGLQ